MLLRQPHTEDRDESLSPRGSVSRDDGFAVMDVSTDIVNDPKIRKLWRYAPDHASAAFTAYIATMAESWKAGRRVSVDDAWPAFLPFDQAAVEALVHVRLLDRTGRVTMKAWSGWFEPVLSRRMASRERWARANANRNADATGLPRGSDADTDANRSVPSSPSVPPVPDRLNNGLGEETRDGPRLVKPGVSA
jgi:hypothetical protein